MLCPHCTANELTIDTLIYCDLCGRTIQAEDNFMIYYKTKTHYQMKDNVTGEMSAHVGELSLPALDAAMAAQAALDAVRLAAGQRCTLTNIQMSVAIAHYTTAVQDEE